MKHLLISLFIINTLFFYAQSKIEPEIEIEYDIHYNTEVPNTKKGTLYVDKSLNQSLFVYGNDKKEKTVKNTEENEIRLMFSESIRFNHVNFLADSIISKDKIYKDEYIISESKPNLKWKLINEIKKIDTITVKKATLNFRGRNYIAWYSDKFPLKFGPWKFHNLPGLILEIYDETKRYHWVMTSFSKSNFEKSIDYSEMTKKVDKIDIKDFVVLRYEKGIKLVNESRLPRGTSINKNKIKRNGIEIKFEWEEKTKED